MIELKPEKCGLSFMTLMTYKHVLVDMLLIFNVRLFVPNQTINKTAHNISIAQSQWATAME
jgi:membrane-bound metal-dependent hydrolase YbcI (DUF457 family)